MKLEIKSTARKTTEIIHTRRPNNILLNNQWVFEEISVEGDQKIARMK
jgi:hypothetical protein